MGDRGTWTVCEPNVSAWGGAKGGDRTKGEHEGMGRASGEHMRWGRGLACACR